MSILQQLITIFYRAANNLEPVREWLLSLANGERKLIGEEIRYVQMKWPIGKPRADHLRGAIWEVRINMPNRIARVLFAVNDCKMLLLHGFIKKTQRTLMSDIDIAETRYKDWRNG